MQNELIRDSEGETVETGWVCVTCGRHATGHFCAHCGEKRREDHDFSLRRLLAEAGEAFFHVDSKIFLTLKTLVTKPGKLTVEFFLGRRKPYMSPLQTFFVCNLLFFVLQPWTGLEILAPPLRAYENNSFLNGTVTRLVDQRLAKKHLSRNNPEQFREFSDRFERVAHLQAKSLILVLAVMMAMVIAVLNFRRRVYFSQHIVFSLHVYAWWLLWLLAILVVMSLAYAVSRASGHQIGVSTIDSVATLLEFGGLGAYLFLASQRFYKDGVLRGLIQGALLTASGFGLFFLYRFLLLFTVLYST
jgi:hypothetical protein